MAFDKLLEERLALIFSHKEFEITSKRMFGGLVFLYKGKMTVGIIKERKMEKIMAESYVSPMDFTGKIMKEYAYISEEGFKSDFDLEKWIDLGVEHARIKLKEI